MSLPTVASAEEVGFSSERLQRVDEVLSADVESGRIPGAVVLLARRGQVAYYRAFGFRDRLANAPMRKDDIFRIASMTKPLTSVATMMLAEQGKLYLPERVANYLPEFARLQVGIEGVDASGTRQLTLVPCTRPMTIQDLLRHTSGLTYGLFGESLVKTMYREGGVFNRNITNEEMVSRLARLPLAYQPGTTWDYSMSTDVLGRIIEVVSSKSLEQFLRENITAPLGMKETGFLIPPEQANRIAQPQPDKLTGAGLPVADPTVQVKWQSGGAGMSSTAPDYFRFCQMLLNGGELDGVRLLSAASVQLMTSDHLPPNVQYDPGTQVLFEAEAPTPEMGQSFGLGFCVRTRAGRNPLPGSVGDYYWAGALGTYFWIDPAQELVVVFLSQAPAERLHYRYVMRQLVYQSLILCSP